METPPSLIKVVDRALTTADTVGKILFKFRGANHGSRISEGNE